MASLLRNHDLFAFLNEHISKNSKESSLTGMGTDFGGRWIIPNDKYSRFYDLLHDYLFVKQGIPLNLVEQPRFNESKPLMLDIDFHYSLETNKIRKFKENHVLNFTIKIGETLRKFYKIEEYTKLRFFITKRPSPYREGSKPFVKDGIHILCPDIALKNEKQKVIRNYILQEGFLKACFDGTGYINDDKEVYDESMTRKQGWFPYGESKPSVPPYLLSNVYVYDTVNDEWEEDTTNYTDRQLLELLSVRYNIPDDVSELRENVKEEYDILLNGKHQQQKQNDEDEQQLQQIQPQLNFQDFAMIPPNDQERNLITKLVMDCLDKKRADSYDSWMKLGWTLHNIEESDEMFKLWMKFSEFSPKFRSNNVAQLRTDFFHKMRGNSSDGPRLTERSLHMWAKHDTPEMYKKIIDDSIHEYIRNEVDGTHYHMAKLMKKIYKNNYVASINNRNTDWYYYDDKMNMWKHINQGIQLKTKISTEVAHYISEVSHKFSLRACDPNISASEREGAQAEVKRYHKMQNNLYTNGFVEATMKMAETVFCDEDFTNKLNKDPYLFACRNGIIQLRVKTLENPNPHVIFRPGIPEDYVSFLAGYNYPEYTEGINYIPYNPNDPIYEEIMDFFNKIFPDKELCKYFLRLLASCLEGCNREQQYYVWEGVGGNGKSKIVTFMCLVFGDYQSSLQATALTRKRPDAGAANPEIMAIKNRRFIYLQEPDPKEPLNTSRMKQFSGEDMVEARGLFKDQEKFKITGKMNMMCNIKPGVDSQDRGTWRRIRVLNFISKFVSEDDLEYISKKKNVFLRDNFLDEKLVRWREHFLSLLVHIYETEYLKNGLEPTPLCVKKASDDYKAANDPYAKFEMECIKKDNNINSTMNEIWGVYGEWYEANGKEYGYRKMKKDDFSKRLANEYGEPQDGKTFNCIKASFNEGFD